MPGPFQKFGRRLGVLGLACVVAVGAFVPTAGASAPRVVDPIAEVASGALVLVSSSPASVTSPSYLAWREQLAEEVGERLAIDPDELLTAWDRADAEHQTALMAALSQLGAPYRRRSADPAKGFDCSGLTAYAWGQAGVSLARNSTRQFREGDARNVFTAQAGDLLRYPGHVMMWLGVGKAIVHSPEPGKSVEVRVLSDQSFKRSGFFDPSE
jgi:hypothetical protein